MSDVVDLGHADRIPLGEGRAFDVRGRKIAVFRTRGGLVYATDATCPHKGGPLADGLLGDGCIVCPLHGYQYELATGAPRGHDCPAIATFPVSVTSDGRIRLELAKP